MKILELELPDFSDHPPPPQLSLAAYERWIFELLRCGIRPTLSEEEENTEWLRNEGSQTEEWPDFGVR